MRCDFQEQAALQRPWVPGHAETWNMVWGFGRHLKGAGGIGAVRHCVFGIQNPGVLHCMYRRTCVLGKPLPDGDALERITRK